ncbi:MAG: GNAT family N-acetyltransferase [Planctomycetes bacterium]|nr:GNAT family N-acetyltransferase [Planctomycetota bacterium]
MDMNTGAFFPETLRAIEVDRRQTGVLEEYFRKVLGHRVSAGLLRKALADAVSGRIIAVKDADGPLLLVPFTCNADDTAQLGAPLFSPRAAGAEPAAIEAAARQIGKLGADVLLAPVPVGSPAEAHFERAGFHPGPKLLEVSRATPTPQEPGPRQPGWTFYNGTRRLRFAEVFYRTLEGSLDVPELPVCRDGEVLMRTFEERGRFEAEDFAILETPEGPAGVLFVVETAGELEIVYFGVVQAMRSRGFGQVLLTKAFERAVHHGAGRIRAAVDSRNAPALEIYRRLGFSEKRAVRVYIKRPKKS